MVVESDPVAVSLDEILVRSLQLHVTRKRKEWGISQYLLYVAQRVGYLAFRTRLAILVIILGVEFFFGYWFHNLLIRTHLRLTSKIPTALKDKIPHGAAVVRSVSPTSITYYVYRGSRLLFSHAFPRGLGMAQQAFASRAQDTMASVVFPWVTAALALLTVSVICYDLLVHRLLPSAKVYLTGADRAVFQLRIRDLPRTQDGRTEADRWRIFTVNEQVAGYSLANLLSVALKGTHVTSVQIVMQNRFRQQPTFGSVVNERTPLRNGWEILLPKNFV